MLGSILIWSFVYFAGFVLGALWAKVFFNRPLFRIIFAIFHPITLPLMIIGIFLGGVVGLLEEMWNELFYNYD